MKKYKFVQKDDKTLEVIGNEDSFILDINGFMRKFILLQELKVENNNMKFDLDKINRYKDISLVKSLLDNCYNTEDILNNNLTFCKFKLDSDFIKENAGIGKDAGVYIWIVDNKVVYIGQAKDIISRFNSGYGHISPRNPFYGGQSTNCKMNLFVKYCEENKKKIFIYFCKTKDYKQLEYDLLDRFKTDLNVQNNIVKE